MTKIKRLASAMLASCMMFSALMMNAGAANLDMEMDKIADDSFHKYADGVQADKFDNTTYMDSSAHEVIPYASTYSVPFIVNTDTAGSDGYNVIDITPDYADNTRIEVTGLWSNSGATMHILLENLNGSVSTYLSLNSGETKKATIVNKGHYRIKMKSNVSYVKGTLQITSDYKIPDIS